MIPRETGPRRISPSLASVPGQPKYSQNCITYKNRRIMLQKVDIIRPHWITRSSSTRQQWRFLMNYQFPLCHRANKNSIALPACYLGRDVWPLFVHVCWYADVSVRALIPINRSHTYTPSHCCDASLTDTVKGNFIYRYLGWYLLT